MTIRASTRQMLRVFHSAATSKRTPIVPAHGRYQGIVRCRSHNCAIQPTRPTIGTARPSQSSPRPGLGVRETEEDTGRAGSTAEVGVVIARRLPERVLSVKHERGVVQGLIVTFTPGTALPAASVRRTQADQSRVSLITLR